jgi:hypothetical protein
MTVINLTPTGGSDVAQINAALVSGNTAILAANSSFYIDGLIAPANNTQLLGKSGTVLNLAGGGIDVSNVDNIELGNFLLQGTISGVTKAALYLIAYGSNHSGFNFHEITITAQGGDQFAVYIANGKTISNLTYANCVSKDSNRFGFVLGGDASVGTTLDNVIFYNCSSINASVAANRMYTSDGYCWDTGFDFAENVSAVKHLSVIHCTVNGAWESAMHFEQDPIVTNAVILDSICKNAGRSDTVLYGAGIYLGNALTAEIILQGNSGSGNAKGDVGLFNGSGITYHAFPYNAVLNSNKTVTRVSQGNCVGIDVFDPTSKTHDVFLYSSDGNAVNQTIKLSDGTVVTASFTDFMIQWSIVAGPTPMRIVGCIKDTDEFNLISTLDYSKLTHTIYCNVYCNSDADPTIIDGVGSPTFSRMVTMTSKTHAAGGKALACIAGGDWNTWSTSSGILNFTSILTNPTLRAKLITNLMNFVSTYNLDGIWIDWESSDVTEAVYHTFLVALRAALPSGKLIAVCAFPDNNYPNYYLTASADAPLVDMFEVMLYGMGTYPAVATYDDFVTFAGRWLSPLWYGFPPNKVDLGIPVSATDAVNVMLTGYYRVVAEYDPDPSLNQLSVSTVLGWNGSPVTVSGGVLWWSGVDLDIQKTQWAMANKAGGVMLYAANMDAVGSPKSLLTNIYNTIIAGGFTHGTVHTANFSVTVVPSGLSCQVELYLGPNASTKSATTGLITFTSTGTVQNLSLSLTMPTAGTYNVYINVYAGGVLVKEYIGTTQVVVV